MAWQDELAALDEALAQGRITADQHRSERDRILAAVSSAPAAGALKWQASNPTAAGQGAPAGDADRTQVVPGGDPNKTAYVQVPRGGFPPPNQQAPQPPQPGRQPGQQPGQQFAPAQPVAPPWASPDAGFGSTGQNWGYARQGPEVFEDTASGGGKKWLLVGLVVVLLLAGGAVWYFGFNGGGSDQAGTTSTAASTPKPEPIKLDRLPNPPGQANEANTGEFTLDEAKTKKIVGANEQKAVAAAGTGKFPHKSSSDNGLGYAVSAFPTKDDGAATELGDALVRQNTSIGMAPLKLSGVPENVSVMQVRLPDSNQYLLRAVYVTGDTTVRVGLLGSAKLAEPKVTEAFDKFLKQVLEAVPAK
ncbi:hypothetical protein FHX81_4273 [Saccharothrix saharensis]|jgi:hypothetical protein|uniref:Flagellar basal body-associated protein FliL n=1 Tax=Saccharothrix saharensis TaxID=571190 RepID=A0A543JGB7_9PSEU|nr:hypothetical protein [Saccharothrix saharensis]TQM81887.1 hypothetical protein FHX81_4273 [Saccharothrix saharensis]